MPTANVYIDGFNLYYGCIRGTPYHWLDLDALARRLLPKDTINRVRYFTAKVSARPSDPDSPVRQQAYLRALATLPSVSVHFGHFLTSTTRMPLAHPVPGAPATVEVIKTEEKGSDVNLAAYLLLDSFKNDCETVVVISNDSDLKEPVRIARYELGMTVGVINPHPPQRRSRVLSRDANFFKQLRATALAACLLPPSLTDAQGTFQRPAVW